ncbi:MAG: thiamine-phosphate kinase [Tepidisphaeraceae bacterium]|jgi:thiamine-monophosphate kinase
MAGEFDFIQWIAAQNRAGNLVQLGVGDDLAVLNWPADDLLLVGVDQVLEGVHFDSAVHSPRQIGKKAINRSVSDCAAMGCLPAAAVATVALPKHFSLDQAKELYLGMRQAAEAFDCPIVGGDTAAWDGKLIATVTILGRTSGIRPVARSGAKAGDRIFVTGPLGGSILGRHIEFVPKVALGRELAALASAMIDISDGLSRDLGHICRCSGVGAILQAESVPIHPDAVELSRRDGRAALEHALHDGEDYELLYTTSRPTAPGICIGRIVEKPGMWLQDERKNLRALEIAGWQHVWGSAP